MNNLIKEARELCGGGYTGPWEVTESRGDCGNVDVDCGKKYCDDLCKQCEHFKFFEGAQIDTILTLCLDEWDGMNDADAYFIANARADIPALLTYIAQLEKERDEMLKEMKKIKFSLDSFGEFRRRHGN